MRQKTTLASIEANHRLKAVSKTIVRKGGERLAKLKPRTVVVLP